MEIEAIYLAGDFGIKTTGEFSNLKREAIRYAGDFSLTNVPVAADISKLHERKIVRKYINHYQRWLDLEFQGHSTVRAFSLEFRVEFCDPIQI